MQQNDQEMYVLVMKGYILDRDGVGGSNPSWDVQINSIESLIHMDF